MAATHVNAIAERATQYVNHAQARAVNARGSVTRMNAAEYAQGAVCRGILYEQHSTAWLVQVELERRELRADAASGNVAGALKRAGARVRQGRRT